MRRRSPSYSPPPRRGRGRSQSRSPSPRGRYPPPRREPPNSLLVRNLPRTCRVEDLRGPFKRFGPLRDIYLPKDYYTGEPRGFGFVQYLDPYDAEEAQYYMNRSSLFGRQLTVVFAEENRKKPVEMRQKERQRGRGFSEDNGRGYYPDRGRSRSRSRSRSRTPRGYRYSRSPSYDARRPPESTARSPSLERHHHRSRRGESGPDRRRGGVDRSRSLVHSRSPVGRHVNHDVRERSSPEHSRSPPTRRSGNTPSHSESPVPRSSRNKSPSPARRPSPDRHGRAPSRSPSPRERGPRSTTPISRSPSPGDDRYQDGSDD